MTIAAAAEDDWLSALAASRQQVAGGAPNSSSSLTTSRDAHGRLVVTTAVRLSPPSLAAAAPSTVAAETSIAQLLLQAFVEQGAAVPRGVEVAVIDAPPAADADAAGVWRHVSFTATEPAAEEQVQEAAGLFEVRHSLPFPVP